MDALEEGKTPTVYFSSTIADCNILLDHVSPRKIDFFFLLIGQLAMVYSFITLRHNMADSSHGFYFIFKILLIFSHSEVFAFGQMDLMATAKQLSSSSLNAAK